LVGLTPAQKSEVNGLLEKLRLLFAPRGFREPHNRILVISGPNDVSLILQCVSVCKGRHFQAEFANYVRGLDPAGQCWSQGLEAPCVATLSIAMMQDVVGLRSQDGRCFRRRRPSWFSRKGADPSGACPLLTCKLNLHKEGSSMVRMTSEIDLVVRIVQQSVGPWSFRWASLDLGDDSALGLAVVGIAAFSDPIDFEAERRRAASKAVAMKAIRLLRRAQVGGSVLSRKKKKHVGGSKGKGEPKSRAKKKQAEAEPEKLEDVAVDGGDGGHYRRQKAEAKQ